VRLAHVRPEEVDLAPKPLAPGVLYISHKYRVALHLCCCGCGEKVVTPLSEAEWQLEMRDGKASLHPSVGNGTACRSHYWIEQNRVVWLPSMTNHQIMRTRRSDRASLETMYAARRHTRRPKWVAQVVAAFEAVGNWLRR
jgi:Family of unknown function (DUF6527)